ncbi:creatinine deaminase [Polychaeton citri CBS 116435]|uniref:Creatinine deaminase n=1 Tax=Polychaeton citri CBS 116435 TaxID=1314669 RepID=A0A9P4USK7_9PEZI|nr:creatinine deaminase [Polychaeton citri CBS 116435]
MLIKNACLRDRDGLWSIEIEDGVITNISKRQEHGRTEDGCFDANGCLVIPQFCENHIHLDYANTAGVPRDNKSGTLFEAIEIWRERKALGLNNAAEIKKNAIEAARSCAGHGVGFIRSHVDVTDPELIALKALLEVKAEIKPWCELQLVAFPQNGTIAFPNGTELMKKAMEMGADVVGGIPHLEPTREDGIASIGFIFDLAEKHNALVDIHCDEIDDSQSRFIEVIAAETSRRGMQGRVTVSHAVAFGYYPPGYVARLVPKLQASGVGFAIAPRENLQLQGRDFGFPVPRGIAPVRDIVDWRMRVAFCQDSVCDPWYPIGDGNPLRNLDTGMHVSHMLTSQYMDDCLKFLTYDPATNMGIRERYGLEEGKSANLIVIDAHSDREALRKQLLVLLSVHKGKEVFRQDQPTMKWRL